MNPKAFGIAAGCFWGLMMLLTTILNLFTGYGQKLLEAFVELYPGYTISLFGSVVGFAYGFVDLFVGGFMIAWLYNKLEDKI